MVRGAGFSATAGRRCGGGWWLWLGSGVAPPVAQGGDAEGYTVCSYSKFVHLDCKAITEHLRAMLLLADEEIQSLKKQSTFHEPNNRL